MKTRLNGRINSLECTGKVNKNNNTECTERVKEK
jgi:hypothetical protein